MFYRVEKENTVLLHCLPLHNSTGVALISKASVIFQQCPLEILESLSGRDTRAISCIRSTTNIASSTYVGLMDHL